MNRIKQNETTRDQMVKLNEIQKIGQKIMNSLDLDCRVKKLKEKLKYKENHCYHKKSIKKTFIKLFNLLTSKIANKQNLFLNVYVDQPYDIELSLMNDKFKVIFTNKLQINKYGVNNFNKYFNANMYFENYYNNLTITNINSIFVLSKKSLATKRKKWIQMLSNNILYSSRYTPDTYTTLTSFSQNYYFTEYGSIYEFSKLQIPEGYGAILFSMCGSGGDGYSGNDSGPYFGGGGSGGYGQFYCPDVLTINDSATGTNKTYIVYSASFGVQTENLPSNVSSPYVFAEIVYQVEGEQTFYTTTFTVGNGISGTYGSSDDVGGAGGAAMTYTTDFIDNNFESFFMGLIQLDGASGGPYSTSQQSIDNYSVNTTTNGYFGESNYYYTCSGPAGKDENVGIQPPGPSTTSDPSSYASGLTLPNNYGYSGLYSVGAGFQSAASSENASGYGAGGAGGLENECGGSGTTGCCQMVFVPKLS